MITKPYPSIDVCATGLRLKALRKEHNIKLDDLALYLKFTSTRAILKWHAGSCLPSLDSFYALSILYDMTINEMIVEVH